MQERRPRFLAGRRHTVGVYCGMRRHHRRLEVRRPGCLAGGWKTRPVCTTVSTCCPYTLCRWRPEARPRPSPRLSHRPRPQQVAALLVARDRIAAALVVNDVIRRKVWVCLNMTPKSALSCGRGRSGPPPNTRFLGPHEYAAPTAFRSVQPFTLITTHTRGQRTDRPRYNGNNRPPLMLYTHSDAGQQLIFTDIAHVSKKISKCSLYKRARRSEKVWDAERKRLSGLEGTVLCRDL